MAKKNGHAAAWFTEGHRPHKYEDVHQCVVDAIVHSEEHPRTVVYIEGLVRGEMSLKVALKAGLTDPQSLVDMRKQREAGGTEGQDRESYTDEQDRESYACEGR